MKIAKIISTCFLPRTVRLKTLLAGNPLVYSLGSQNFITKEEIRDLILFNIEQEKNCNPGAYVDIVFVNNDVKSEWGNKFINSLNGMKINSGKIIIVHNDNLGWSYGAYNKGYKILENKYDYYIFTEDDIIIAKNNYAKIGVDCFNSVNNCGFVSYLGYSNSGFGLPKKDAFHAHNSAGLTSNKVLSTLVQKFGHIPHSNSDNIKDYKKIIIDGEIAFTNSIYKLGYDMVEIPSNTKLFEPAYDLMRNTTTPWKPNSISIILYYSEKYFRNIAYKILKILGLNNFYSKLKSRILSYIHNK